MFCRDRAQVLECFHQGLLDAQKIGIPLMLGGESY